MTRSGTINAHVGAGPPRRFRKVLRGLLAASVIALLAAVVASWFLRDVPRRRVEAGLAERLGAEVRLGGLTVEGMRQVLLRDLVVQKMTSQPWLESASIGSLVATGGLLDMTNGKFEALHVADVDVRLAQPPAGKPPPPPSEPARFEAGRIEIERTHIVLAAGGGETSLEMSASLRDMWSDLAGEVTLRSDHPIALGPLLGIVAGAASMTPAKSQALPSPDGRGTTGLGLDGRGTTGSGLGGRGTTGLGLDGQGTAGSRCDGSVDGFEARFTISGAGRKIEAKATARSIALLREGRRLSIDAPALDAELEQASSGGPIRVAAKVRLPLAETASVTLTVDPGTRDLLRVTSEVKSLRLEPILAFSAPSVAELLRGLWDPASSPVRGGDKAPARRGGDATPATEIVGESNRTSAHLVGREHLATSGGNHLATSGGELVADLELKGITKNQADYRLTLRAPEMANPQNSVAVRAEHPFAEVEGTLRLGAADRGATIRARIDLPGAPGEIAGTRMPPELFPVRVSFDGDLALANAIRLDGQASAETASAGRIEVSGRACLARCSGRGGEGARGDARTSLPTGAGTGPGDSASIATGNTDAGTGFGADAANGAAADAGAIGGTDSTGIVVGSTDSAPVAVGDGAAEERDPMKLDWSWRGADLGRLFVLVRAVGLALPEFDALHGSVEAQGTLVGRLEAPAVTGELVGRDVTVDWSGSAGRRHAPPQAISDAPPSPASHALPPTGSAAPRQAISNAPAPWSIAGALPPPISGAPPPSSSDAPSPKAASSSAPRASRISPPDTAPRDEGAKDAENGKPAANSSGVFSFREGRVRVRFAWKAGASPLEVSSCEASGVVQAHPLDPVPFTLTASGRVAMGGGDAVLDALALEATGLARVKARGRTGLASLARTLHTASDSEAQGAESPTARPPRTPTEAGSKDQPIPVTQPVSTRAGAQATQAGQAGQVLQSAQTAMVKIHLDDVSLPHWRSFLRPLLGDPAPGYDAKGDVTSDLEATLGADARWAVTGKATITKSGFGSEDGSQVLEGLDTTWDLRLEGSSWNGPSRVEARAAVSGFQILWGSFFADATNLTSTLELSATESGASAGAASKSGSWSARGAWSFPSGPRVEATLTGEASSPVAYTLSADVADLGSTVDRYLRGPLGDSVPFFSKIKAAGSLRTRLSGSVSERARSVRGRVELDGLRLSGTQGFAEVNGLDLDLPLDLEWTATSVAVTAGGGDPGFAGPRGEELKGSLRFASLTVGGLEIPAVSTGLQVRTDSISLEEGLAVPLFGGVLGFEGLSLSDLLRPARRLETGILLSRLSVGEASKAFSLPPLEGTMEGYFPRVRLTPATLSVDGGGEVSLFGGTVKLGDISGEEILSHYPKVTVSADFEGIDLQKVTRTFDFGEMTGILRGSVHECELFRGVPVRFEGFIETVERKGVSRRINVKAINNLAILGTGGGVNIFDRGIHKFLDSYTYDRVGIGMSLHNDAFLLRGRIQDRGRELFLKGRLPFPINIINAQPGTTVSFRTMVERLKALDFSTVKTSR